MMSHIPQILTVRLQTSVSLRKRKCTDSQIVRKWKNAALCPIGTDLHHQSGDYRINIWLVLGTENLNTSLPHHKKKKNLKCSWLSHRTTNKGHRTGWQTHCDGYEAAQLSFNHLDSMDSIKSHRIHASVCVCVGGGVGGGQQVRDTCNRQVFKKSYFPFAPLYLMPWLSSVATTFAGLWDVWVCSSRILLSGLYFFHIFDCICAGSASICRFVNYIQSKK